MLKIYEVEKIAILVDFDGTITTTDTNDELVYKNMNDNLAYLMKIEKELNYIKLMDAIFKEIKMTEDQYLEFILNEVHISKGFNEFYKTVKSKEIPLSIVSGGFYNGIIPFLNKHGVKDVDIYANTLNFNGKDITVDYYHNGDYCCEAGPCGNCKIKHYEKLKDQGYKVIFIGDGMSDQAVATRADVVFAKDGLLEFCTENNIDYIPWKDFRDINEFLFKDDQLI